MSDIYTIKIDNDDENYLNKIEVKELFPEHYFPSIINSDDGIVVDIGFTGGTARFYFNKLDIECQFDYFDEDEDYNGDFQNMDLLGEDFTLGLVEYIADKVTEQTTYRTSY